MDDNDLPPALKGFLIDAQFHEDHTEQTLTLDEGRQSQQIWKRGRALGKGSFGSVFQERWEDENGSFEYRAVKVCSLLSLKSSNIDFRRELSALAALSSPQVFLDQPSA